MNDNPLVSIIIPIYNVEKYLVECIESVINQTYTNIEILCIDDYGSDGSMGIIQNYAKKDNRIKILHHNHNKGLAPARNTGLDNAKGKYIFFLDSDDFIEKNVIELLVKKIIKTNSDIAISKTNTFSQDANLSKNRVKEVSEYLDYTPIDEFEVSIENFDYSIMEISCVSWGKLYSYDFIAKNNLRFVNENIIHEDNGFYLKILSNFPKITMIENISVNYRLREKSITSEIEKSNNIKKKNNNMKKSLLDAISYIRKTHDKKLAKKLVKSITSSKLYERYLSYNINLFGLKFRIKMKV